MDEEFDKLINAAKEGLPEDANFTVYDDISAYASAFANNSRAAYDAKVERIKELESELSKQKATNYDLMTRIPVDDSSKNNNDDKDEDDKPRYVEDLFQRVPRPTRRGW